MYILTTFHPLFFSFLKVITKADYAVDADRNPTLLHRVVSAQNLFCPWCDRHTTIHNRFGSTACLVSTFMRTLIQVKAQTAEIFVFQSFQICDKNKKG